MEYILLNLDTLEVSVSSEPKVGEYAIPTSIKPGPRPMAAIEEIILDPGITLDQLKPDQMKEPPPGDVFHSTLDQVPPWVIWMVMTMLGGIVSGMAWDAVKHLVNRGLRKVKVAGLAPTANPFDELLTRVQRTISQVKPASSTTKSSLKTEFGIEWDDYASDKEKRRRLFFSLEGKYETMSKEGFDKVIEKPPPPDS